MEATEAEIAYITGLSLRGVRAILDSHYLSRDPALVLIRIAYVNVRDNRPGNLVYPFYLE